jgi:nucleoside phosphorylase
MECSRWDNHAMADVITSPMRRVLNLLAESSEPLSGRNIAMVSGLSPTTVNSALKSLETLEAVARVQEGRSFRWSVRSTAATYLDEPSAQDLTSRTVLVATALPLEFIEVKNRMLDVKTIRSKSGARYAEGSIPGNHVRWRVLLAQLQMGNVSAAGFFAQAIEELDVDFAVFVGIAAGLKSGDQRRGDVVVGLSAHAPSFGKDTRDPAGSALFQSRALGLTAAKSLEHLARSVINDSEDWNPATKRKPNRPKAFLGPIVSVESVQSNADSELMKVVGERFNNALALDMESFGAYSGAHLHGVPAIAIRGISDFVYDKSIQNDTTAQPRAASNAAHFLGDMLYFADPDDIPSRASASPPNSEPTDSQRLTPELPPGMEVWERRLRARSSSRADAAVSELSRVFDAENRTLATWLNRTLHRPPEWLRLDDTGDGWALVAQLASATSLRKADGAYALAADAASASGDHSVAVLHRVNAVLAAVRPNPESPSDLESVARQVLEVDISQAEAMRSLLDFWAAAVRTDLERLREVAPKVLTALGVDPVRAGLSPTNAVVAPYDLEPDIARQAAAVVLISVATGSNLVDDAEAALPAAELAYELAPSSTSTLFAVAQSRLVRVLNGVTHVGVTRAATAELLDIESTALLVKRRRESWGGPTAEPLALAARVRAQYGDPRGALRMLRPPPFGTATIAESRDQSILRIVVLAAILAGDTEVALEAARDTHDNVEALISRGSALSSSSGMKSEADAAFRSAIAAAGDDSASIRRALLGLARLGTLLEDSTASEVLRQIEEVSRDDPQFADIVRAVDDGANGRYEDAIRRTRKFPGSALAAEVQAEALIRLAREQEAVEVLDGAGAANGDNTLRVRAMMLAGNSQNLEKANAIADELIASGDIDSARQARIAKMHLARQAQDWRVMELHAAKLLDMSDATAADLLEDSQTEFRWLRVEALYHLERYQEALQNIRAQPQLPFESRGQVSLLFALVRLTAADGKGLSPDVFDLVLTVSALWTEDDDVMAEALNTILGARVDGELTESQITKARDLQEKYFSRNPDSGRLTRIQIDGDDLTPLFELLKTQLGSNQESLQDLNEKVWLGQFPQALLSDVSSRSYAEVLIKSVVGCYPALDGGDNAIDAQSSAADALERGEVVVDTSALVVGPKFAGARNELTALFKVVHFPAWLRADVEAGRMSLAMRSKASMGWNSKADQPIMTQFESEDVEAWAKEADSLREDMALLRVAADDPTKPNGKWEAALQLAQRLNLAVWADDRGLRAAAREMGLKTFGTEDLVQAGKARGMTHFPSDAQRIEAMKAARVVDLELGASWVHEAETEGWSPNGYMAISLSRPAAWKDLPSSFARFQRLIRSRPQSMSSKEIAGWTSRACRGVASSVAPGRRPEIVGLILAWVALNCDPVFALDRIVRREYGAVDGGGDVLGELLEMGTAMQPYLFPDGDALAQTVQSLSRSLMSGVDPATSARVMTIALSSLPTDLRQRALEIFLATPASRDAR